MPRIICLMSDTFRYDYLGYLAEQDINTPELDELASEAVSFADCHVSSFPTIPNREDLFCGTYGFPHHGWQPLSACVQCRQPG